MPPCLDGSLGIISTWGAESSEEEDQWAAGSGGDDDADEAHDGGDDGPAYAEPPAVEPPQQVRRCYSVISFLLLLLCDVQNMKHLCVV